MANNYTTKTAALKSTTIDTRLLDAKKITIDGEDILTKINTTILDERGTLANGELDIWNNYVTKDEKSNVIINRSAKPFAHTYETISSTQFNTLKSAVKVIDNEVLGADNAHLMYWQIDGLTDGNSIFEGCSNLSEFDSDLSNLTDAREMFKGTNLTTFYSDLSNLTNGYEMFAICSYLKTFNSNLSSLTDGTNMFERCANLISFNYDLSNLTSANTMFSYCSNLRKFTSDLSSLTMAESMFYNCYNLTTFNSDLSSLKDGSSMFYSCSALNTFISDLSSLMDGYGMFDYCYNLNTFISDLSNLTIGNRMFYYCENLTSFNSNLTNLSDGYDMFASCSQLTSFNSNLSSLTDGRRMFSSCKLNAPSVANIIYFIPQRDSKPTSSNEIGSIKIGIGISNTDAEKQAFAEECYCDSWQDLLNEFDAKNWIVEFQFNGSATTYSLRKPSTVVYTKLEEVFMPTEEEIQLAKENNEHIIIPHYEYVSQDGDNFYNIHWYHDSNTNNEGYDCFESLEMATLSYGVLPKE